MIFCSRLLKISFLYFICLAGLAEYLDLGSSADAMESAAGVSSVVTALDDGAPASPPASPSGKHGAHGSKQHKSKMSASDELSNLLEAQEKEELEEHHIAELRRQQLPWYQRLCDSICECFASLLHSKKDSLDSIFWLNRPWLFFITVEFTFLVECFYISLYMTQLLPIAKHTEDFYAWAVVLLLPILLSVILLQFILPKAVLLHSISLLDKEVSE